jgi:hypothetical protein
VSLVADEVKLRHIIRLLDRMFDGCNETVAASECNDNDDNIDVDNCSANDSQGRTMRDAANAQLIREIEQWDTGV